MYRVGLDKVRTSDVQHINPKMADGHVTVALMQFRQRHLRKSIRNTLNILRLRPTSSTMPPRLNILGFVRVLPLRPSPQAQWLRPVARTSVPPQIRSYSDSKEPPATVRPKSDVHNTIPHVSEEASNIAKITGSDVPDLNQGTPVEEVGSCSVCKDDRLTVP